MRYALFFVALLIAANAHAAKKVFYVDASASSNGAGTSWAAPLQNSQVNDSVDAYDGLDTVEVFFNTGDHRFEITPPNGGTATKPIIYACSAYADTNSGGTYHFARINGADSIGGWSDAGGGEYTKTSGGWDDKNYWAWQRNHDSLLIPVANEVDVNVAGEIWTDGTNLRVYCWNGDNPNTVGIEKVTRYGATLANSHYVTFYGLDIAYVNQHGLFAAGQSSNDTASTWITIRDCHFRYCSGTRGTNVGLIGSGKAGQVSPKEDDLHEDWLIVSCSLGYQWAFTDNSLNETGTNNSAILSYSNQRWVVDSCVFYGYIRQACWYIKNSSTLGSDSTWMIVDSNQFINNYCKSSYGNGTAMVKDLQMSRSPLIAFNRHIAVGDGHLYNQGYSFGDSVGHARVFNNTAHFTSPNNPRFWYDEDSSASVAGGQGFKPRIDQQLKYNAILAENDMNVLVDTTQAPGFDTQWDQPATLDSNLFYVQVADLDNNLEITHHPDHATWTYAKWQDTVGWEVRSTRADTNTHDFNNLATNDYSRPTSSQEMDRTYTLGRTGETYTVTATRFGWWQPDPSARTTTKVSGNVKVSGGVKLK